MKQVATNIGVGFSLSAVADNIEGKAVRTLLRVDMWRMWRDIS